MADGYAIATMAIQAVSFVASSALLVSGFVLLRNTDQSLRRCFTYMKVALCFFTLPELSRATQEWATISYTLDSLSMCLILVALASFGAAIKLAATGTTSKIVTRGAYTFAGAMAVIAVVCWILLIIVNEYFARWLVHSDFELDRSTIDSTYDLTYSISIIWWAATLVAVVFAGVVKYKYGRSKPYSTSANFLIACIIAWFCKTSYEFAITIAFSLLRDAQLFNSAYIVLHDIFGSWPILVLFGLLIYYGAKKGGALVSSQVRMKDEGVAGNEA
ncbi:hypothetical protein S40285_10031 [Stachybotrys chlorohalonatus IBT 40285]|uniref:Uncharacterized protein n=1 Tax=Stachybotrys chlorohalonatus (strain IBT 40285) TaxID=1283841 RepID=A0A084QMZ7_STAC4|nr:hypothetical protein S40285_10031 [Stachybotrys chlorohalonata IBT 40285]